MSRKARVGKVGFKGFKVGKAKSWEATAKDLL